MKPVKENIDVDIAPKPKSDEPTPQELLAALTEKTEGGAE